MTAFDGLMDYENARNAEVAELRGQIDQLLRAEEGAKEAFGVLVEQKRELEKKCRRLQDSLNSALEIIRHQTKTPNERGQGERDGVAGTRSPAP